jgi:ribosomal protein S18 acetylase RimI-like enzyme
MEFYSLCGDIAAKTQRLCLQAKGGSMYPFIRSGDWVDVALFGGTEKNIRKGDIVLFKKDESLYLHRILRREGDVFFAKGDMSFGHDGAISIDDVFAKVVSINRGSRRIDMCTRANRFFSVIYADLSIFLQYPFLLARKICAYSLKILSRIQAFKFYRLVLKKVLNAKVIIRPAGTQDQEQLMDLYLMAGHDVKEGLAAVKNEGFWLVAERKNKIVAGLTMTRYEKDPALWVIFGLEVKPLFRGMGIGRKIVAAAILKARESDARSIGLFVNKDAEPALKLYRQLGFTAADDFPGEFNRSGHEFYLSYKINA